MSKVWRVEVRADDCLVAVLYTWACSAEEAVADALESFPEGQSFEAWPSLLSALP
jgi:hypothetical protein